MAKGKDLAWLVGLLEGEGSFGLWHSGVRTRCLQPRVCLGMTDRDVVRHAAKILGVPLRGPYKYAATDRPIYKANVYGAKAIVWMSELYPHMGRRRKAKMREILTGYRRQGSGR